MTLALVTAGGRRIGAAIVMRLAAGGAAIALHMRHAEPLDPALERALDEQATRWRVFEADFDAADAAETLVARVADWFGAPPDQLVNNAARFGEGAEMADYLAHFRVNAAAPALLATAVAALASAAAPAAIVNILDQRIANPPHDQPAYTASKLALAGMTRQLARSLAPHARVNAVAPGLTLPTADYGEDQCARLGAAMPLGRLPGPAEIADAVAWLLAARAVTGQTLFVDGGAHLESWPRDFVHLAREEEQDGPPWA